jgi:hypothetical protein
LPPTAIEGAGGVTAIDDTVAAVTVNVTAGEVFPPKAAVMFVVPTATPVARPVAGSIVALAGTLEVQLAEAVTSTVGP